MPCAIAGTPCREMDIARCKYGAHVDDHWSLDEVLAQAQAWRDQCSCELVDA